ncbi:uncharacterized protein LOC117620381 [Prunus dulcis]|uniref:uncharacterized protein LOC117620381 n=1 Tax=Prunus dulcis TaxID=3755 RepID=UPI0014825BC7|nr:uncharacterized protein LOC117620381 [Prunus dulcis]
MGSCASSLVYYKEAEAIHHIKFRSEPERAKYLKDSRASNQSSIGLLDAGNALEGRFRNDDARASVAREIFGYIVNGTNHALQSVPNYSLRKDYVEKITEHVEMLGNALEVADGVVYVAKEATEYRRAMYEYTRRHQTSGGSVSRQFSRWLEESGIKFEGLVQRYQAQLKFQGRFKDLKDVQKIQAYEEIIVASGGRGSVRINRLLKGFRAAGIAVNLFVAGLTVWEIFTADIPLEKATHEAVVIAASAGGLLLGEVVGVALATCVCPNPVSVVMVGIIFGIAGAFLLGEFAGWLVNLIFEAGGSFNTLSTDGHQCYIAPMPNGVILALQIVHQSQLKN